MNRARTVVLAVGLLGGLVACAAALRTGRYTSVWLESQASCELAGECTAAEAAAALRWLWWPVAGGLAVLAVAAVLLAWTLPPASPRVEQPRPAPVHALLAGLIAFGTALLAGFPLLIAAFWGPHAIVVALAAAWLAQAAAVLLAGRSARWGLAAPGQDWLAALLVSGLGAGAVVLTWQLSDARSVTVLPVVDAVVVATAVLAQRALRRVGHPPAWPSVAGGLAVLAAGMVLLVALLTPAAPVAPTVSPAPLAEPTPTPTPAPAPAPAAPPVPEPAPEPVVADQPCAQSDLTFRVGGFDAAMGARAAAVEATNTGAAPCWLEGVPVVVLLQGGRPLALQVGPGETPQGTPAQAQRVGVAPGGSAFALLTWRSYGGWADLETPQAVTVALDASSTLVAAEVDGGGAAPFDIADGGAWGIAPWAPPWN
ncbi:DUF4232 domain-containing protein [Modestobacter italicus]|uniref:DUF4232 domain-containing protein n=1 Tax=Modestobacter italicus (strain DSM 44449 / CECT 9708 / BC 501) TaxID=2732864 RepID=UPI001C96DEE7|nr:DUF4232 domain-containing protein [Modestobacter italicus]